MIKPTATSVLLADIGGTHARFALGATDAQQPVLTDSVRHYRVADFDRFTLAARHYLDAVGAHVDRAVLAVAGPIRDTGVRFTNNPWRIAVADARAEIGLTDLLLVNDFAALSMSLPLLGAGQVDALDDRGVPVLGARARQTFGVIGPGTGLGVGALLHREGRYHCLQTEGGHVSFAPTTALQVEILARMHARVGHVFNESLVSGHGLLTLYRVLAEIEGVDAGKTAPEQITAAASDASDPLCERAVQTFCAIFGAIAGDAALMFGAWDGIYLAGGLSPILRPWLRQSAFRHHFEDKSERRDVLREVPMAVICDADAGLYGAAAVALQRSAHV